MPCKYQIAGLQALDRKEAEMKTGSPLAPWMGVALRVVAVALMLGGVVMIFTDASTGIAFPVIAIGIALIVIAETGKRRHPRTSH